MKVLEFLREYDIQNTKELEDGLRNKIGLEAFTAIHDKMWKFCRIYQMERLEEVMECMCELWRKIKEWEKEHPGQQMKSIRHAEAEFDVFNFKSLKKYAKHSNTK